MLADLQRPAPQENEGLGIGYGMVCFVSEYVACFALAARHVLARQRDLYRPCLPSYGDLLSAGLERLIYYYYKHKKRGASRALFFLMGCVKRRSYMLMHV